MTKSIQNLTIVIAEQPCPKKQQRRKTRTSPLSPLTRKKSNPKVGGQLGNGPSRHNVAQEGLETSALIKGSVRRHDPHYLVRLVQCDIDVPIGADDHVSHTAHPVNQFLSLDKLPILHANSVDICARESACD